MKRISDTDLTRFALAKGATIVEDGRQINAGRQKMALAPAPRPIEAPPSPAAPTGPDLAGVVAAIEASHANIGLLAQLVAAMNRQRGASPQPITEWDFDIARGPDKLITAITATARRST